MTDASLFFHGSLVMDTARRLYGKMAILTPPTIMYLFALLAPITM